MKTVGFGFVDELGGQDEAQLVVPETNAERILAFAFLASQLGKCPHDMVPFQNDLGCFWGPQSYDCPKEEVPVFAIEAMYCDVVGGFLPMRACHVIEGKLVDVVRNW